MSPVQFDAAALAAVTSAHARGLSDLALLDGQRALAGIRRQVDAALAVYAHEIARRSDPEFGLSGLAQGAGARTPQNLVQQLTGVSKREAAALVRVGSAEGPVAAAVAEGALSVAAADAILTGLGAESAATSAGDLAAAAAGLVELAPGLSPEELAARAREARGELDAGATVAGERERRERRYLSLSLQDDGMTRVHGLLDPESAAIVKGALDSATSPRLGGPRFVFSGDAERAEAIEHDTRTTEQLRLDVLVGLVKLGAHADTSMLLPPGPAVKAMTTVQDLHRHAAGQAGGAGYLEGQTDAISMDSMERLACDCGIQPALFDETGQALDLGRTQRLFSGKQRVMLAMRDGGCRYPGCQRPPGWCEAHHITPWSLGGKTDVRDGILLCRFHHMQIHDNHWRVVREGSEYLLIPPRAIDPAQRPQKMPPKSAAIRRLLAS